MDEYISRVGIIAEYDRQHNGPSGGARKIMETFPAADVRPVVRGEWERKRYGPWASRLKCSECGTLFDIATDSASWNFCPNCGANMREENDG